MTTCSERSGSGLPRESGRIDAGTRGSNNPAITAPWGVDMRRVAVVIALVSSLAVAAPANAAGGCAVNGLAIADEARSGVLQAEVPGLARSGPTAVSTIVHQFQQLLCGG